MYYKHETGNERSITIRTAEISDRGALERLAGRDSATVPVGDLLVALVGDEIRAAVATGGGEAIADPFHPTAELLRLLRSRAAQVNGAAAGRARRGPIGALRRRHRATLSAQPAGTLRPQS